MKRVSRTPSTVVCHVILPRSCSQFWSLDLNSFEHFQNFSSFFAYPWGLTTFTYLLAIPTFFFQNIQNIHTAIGIQFQPI